MKRQLLVIVMCFVLAISPLVWVSSAVGEYPPGPFGGGGGDALDCPSSHMVGTYLPVFQCGTLCKIVVGWVVGKIMQYGYDQYQGWWNNGQPNGGNYSGGPVGGGGGDTF